MKYIDLFAGIGGFRLGIEKAFRVCGQPSDDTRGTKPNLDVGYKDRQSPSRNGSENPTCVYSNEWDKYASEIYKKHFGECDTRDITKVPSSEIPDHDLLVGGFPCQAFSVAGKRKGFDDTRGTLFFDIARILRDKRPRYFLLENVKGLLSHDEGQTFQTILGVLTDLGYEYQWQVLNSKNFGVPQNRERVFIVGHIRGTSRPKVFPIERDSTKSIVPTIRATYWKGYQTRGPLIMRDGRDNRNVLRSGRTPEVGFSGLSIRRLTPIECERLQGFPDGWTEGISDTQRYKCLGNAVTVNVVEEIILKLKE